MFIVTEYAALSLFLTFVILCFNIWSQWKFTLLNREHSKGFVILALLQFRHFIYLEMLMEDGLDPYWPNTLPT